MRDLPKQTDHKNDKVKYSNKGRLMGIFQTKDLHNYRSDTGGYQLKLMWQKSWIDNYKHQSTLSGARPKLHLFWDSSTSIQQFST